MKSHCNTISNTCTLQYTQAFLKDIKFSVWGKLVKVSLSALIQMFLSAAVSLYFFMTATSVECVCVYVRARAI